MLKVISKDPRYNITILVKRHQDLVNAFREYGKTYVLKGKLYQKKNAGTLLRAFRAFTTAIKKSVIYPQLTGTDIIVSNTITNGRMLKQLSFLKAKVVCYVHELENLISNWRPVSDIYWSVKLAKLFMVPSTAVRDNLISNHSVNNESIVLFNTYLPAPGNANTHVKDVARKQFCEQHHINTANFLVAGMGSADQRKGIDLFVEAACRLKSMQHITFVWIGGFVGDSTERAIRQRISDTGANVVFTGQLPRSPNNLLPFDLFFLSSREDPYPLVVLEAAALQVPSICFSGSGGIVDFIGNDNGWVIEGFSTEKVADTIVHLSNHRDELARAGKNAYERFARLHNDRERMIQQFDEIIHLVLRK